MGASGMKYDQLGAERHDFSKLSLFDRINDGTVTMKKFVIASSHGGNSRLWSSGTLCYEF
jgi:hypothetical protein